MDISSIIMTVLSMIWQTFVDWLGSWLHWL
jgi:hypothetical protein